MKPAYLYYIKFVSIFLFSSAIFAVAKRMGHLYDAEIILGGATLALFIIPAFLGMGRDVYWDILQNATAFWMVIFMQAVIPEMAGIGAIERNILGTFGAGAVIIMCVGLFKVLPSTRDMLKPKQPDPILIQIQDPPSWQGMIKRESIRIKGQMSRSLDDEDSITVNQWINAIVYFNGMCAYCKKKPFEALDHYIPVNKGGKTTAGNSIPVCKDCNAAKHARNPQYALSESTQLRIERYFTSINK